MAGLLSMWHCFSVQCWPLSVHLVKGLSAAGVEVESEGSTRVQAASEECLSLSACGQSGCSWWEKRARGEGRPRWSLCSCHVDTRLSSSHHLLPFKSAKNTSRWTSQKTLIYRARPFVHMGWKLPSTRRSHVVISFTCPNQRKCVNILSEKKGSRYFTNYSKHKKMTAYFLCRMVFGVN